MDKTRAIVLFDSLFFSGPQEACQSAIQSDNSLKNYCADSQIDTVIKTIYFSLKFIAKTLQKSQKTKIYVEVVW